jgi:hypothetical protein
MKFIGGLLKKVGIALAVLVLIAVVFGGGSGEKSSSSNSSKKEEAAASQESKSEEKAESKEEAPAEAEAEPEPEAAEDEGPAIATDSKYAVTIDSYRIVEDYDGAPCIAINYTFSNVSDDSPTSMMLATSIAVYQNGVQCEDAYFSGENSDGYSNKIKAGASVEVTRTYKLQDTTSDVEVEVGQNSFWSDDLLAYTVITLA